MKQPPLFESRLHRIEVQWPGGAKEVFPGGKAKQIVKLTQGTGSPAPAQRRGAARR